MNVTHLQNSKKTKTNSLIPESLKTPTKWYHEILNYNNYLFVIIDTILPIDRWDQHHSTNYFILGTGMDL